MKRCVQNWRKLLIDSLEPDLAAAAKKANEHKLRRMMDVLRGKIRFPADVNNHGYFLREPDFLGRDATVAAKVLKQVKLEKKAEVVKELQGRLQRLDSFSALGVNKACSLMLFELSKSEKGIRNEDVFSILRLAVTATST
jgi:hypothetical protein